MDWQDRPWTVFGRRQCQTGNDYQLKNAQAQILCPHSNEPFVPAPELRILIYVRCGVLLAAITGAGALS